MKSKIPKLLAMLFCIAIVVVNVLFTQQAKPMSDSLLTGLLSTPTAIAEDNEPKGSECGDDSCSVTVGGKKYNGTYYHCKTVEEPNFCDGGLCYVKCDAGPPSS